MQPVAYPFMELAGLGCDAAPALPDNTALPVGIWPAATPYPALPVAPYPG